MPNFCPKCGNPIKGNAKFCNKCGNKLQAADQKSNTQSFEQQTSNLNQQRNMPPPPPPQNNMNNYPNQPQTPPPQQRQQMPPPPPPAGRPNAPRQPMPPAGYPPKKSKKKLLIGVIAVVVVLAVIFALYFFVLSEKTGSDKAEQVVQEYFDAFQNEDWDKVMSMAMDSDGSFLSNAQKDENITNMESSNYSFEINSFKILKSKKLGFNAKNTEEIYAVKVEIKATYSNAVTGESETGNKTEDIVYVAKNKNNDKWGLAFGGFDLVFGADQYEPDDEYQNATTISVGSSQNHNLHDNKNIEDSWSSDVDWFKFTLNSKSTVNIIIPSEEYYSGSPDIKLYDDSIGEGYSIYSAQVASSYDYYEDDDENWAKIEKELEAGTYYIRVEDYNTVPSYKLQISTT